MPRNRRGCFRKGLGIRGWEGLWRVPGVLGLGYVR